MRYQRYRSDLTDTQWQSINDLIPAAKPGEGPRRRDMRFVVNALVYVVVGGIQWRMLPREHPRGRACSTSSASGAIQAYGTASMTRYARRCAAGQDAITIPRPGVARVKR
jgi:transposase